MSKKLTIEEMQEIAKKRKGKCLSSKYIDSRTKLKWECEKGHTWESVQGTVKNGHWCPDCSGKKKLTIEEMQKIAKKRKGKCLSAKYINAHTKLKWECEKGHTWEASPNRVKQGTWCPECNIYINEEICRETFKQLFINNFKKIRPRWLVNSRGNKMELDGYCESLNIAFEYNGEQHYDEIKFFSNNKLNYLETRKNDDLEKIKICKEKNIFLFIISYKDDISKISDLIKSQSKLLGLNTSNIDFNKKIDYSSIYYDETSLNELKKVVKEKNGKLLSKTYFGSRTKLKFQCQKGHTWEAPPYSVQSGRWCLDCSNRKKLTIEEMQEIAKKRKGKCLSTKYINTITKLKWECEKGHTWEAIPISVKSGRWCPKCRVRKT